jgi:hypothetical protein
MPRPGDISARRWRQWAYESLIAIYDSTTLAPAGYVSHEGAVDAGLAGAGSGDGYRRRLRGLRPPTRPHRKIRARRTRCRAFRRTATNP